MSRTLIHVPVLHDPFSELGWKADEDFMSDFAVIAYLQEFNLFWDVVGKKLDDKKIDKIYQDSYIDEKESNWFDGSKQGRNLECLINLRKRGAKLMSTESKPLIAAHNYALEHEPQHKDVLRFLREDYIAQKINRTLLEEETGVLFLGFLHHNIRGLIRYHSSDIVCEGDSIPKNLLELFHVVALKYTERYLLDGKK